MSGSPSQKTGNNSCILAWISRRFFDKSIKVLAASNNSIAAALNYINTKLQIKFDGSCSKEDKVTFKGKKVVNIYIVYEISLWLFTDGEVLTLGNFTEQQKKLYSSLHSTGADIYIFVNSVTIQRKVFWK